NGYTGATYLSGGVLSLGNANAIAGGGNFVFTGGTMQFGTSGTWANVVASSTSAMVFDTNGQSATLSGAIGSTNTAGLTKLGSGTLTLSGSNTYAGTTTISAGVLRAGGNAAFGSNSALSIANTAGATLDLNGYSATVGSLNSSAASSGGIVLGTGTLTINNASGNAVNSFTLPVSGAGQLVKTGYLLQEFNTTATGSIGGIQVNQGKLHLVNGAVTTTIGSFSQGRGGVLYLSPGSGTIASTAANTNGIIGPWAVFSASGLVQAPAYATVSGGVVTAYTGATPVSTGAQINDTTGTVNYDVLGSSNGASITLPSSNVTANTIRISGTQNSSNPYTVTIPTGYTLAVNGIMTGADSSAQTTTVWRVTGGTLTSGTGRELVVIAGGTPVEIASNFVDSSAGATALTVSGQWSTTNGSHFTLGGTSTFTGDFNFSGAYSGQTYGPVIIGGGRTSWAQNFNVANANSLVFAPTVSSTFSGSINSTTGLGVNGSVTLTGTNNFPSLQIGNVSGNGVGNLSQATSSGTVTVSSIGMSGVASAAGTGNITLGGSTFDGVLRYIGAGNTTDRVFSMAGTTGGATLDASGSGPLVFSSAMTATGAGIKTLTLTGSSTAANSIAAIVDSSAA
ncbi:MAG: autotransporter-associated beta strand repeat-containing protein, partial [Planctomycetota bacterium]